MAEVTKVKEGRTDGRTDGRRKEGGGSQKADARTTDDCGRKEEEE